MVVLKTTKKNKKMSQKSIKSNGLLTHPFLFPISYIKPIISFTDLKPF